MEPVSKTLVSLYRGTPEHGPWVVACLEGAWPGLVGEGIARACRPAKWEDYCLQIEVLDASWAETLDSLRGDLLERIRGATANEVRSLIFR